MLKLKMKYLYVHVRKCFPFLTEYDYIFIRSSINEIAKLS